MSRAPHIELAQQAASFSADARVFVVDEAAKRADRVGGKVGELFERFESLGGSVHPTNNPVGLISNRVASRALASVASRGIMAVLAQPSQGRGIMTSSLGTLVWIGRSIIVFASGAAFGAVIGWLVYRTVSRAAQTQISDLAAMVGAVGGAATTALLPASSMGFSGYCIGLAIGFFAYLRARKAADPTIYERWMALPPTGSSGSKGSADPGQPAVNV